MYLVTNDYKSFVPYNNKQEAINIAKMFQGIVFLGYKYNNVAVYSYTDDL